MRRFELTGPEVFVGGINFSRLDGTILVREGKIAVLADDDPRADDLANSPYFREVTGTDSAPAPEAAIDAEPTTSDTTDVPPTDGHEAATSRRRKSPADSGGV